MTHLQPHLGELDVRNFFAHSLVPVSIGQGGRRVPP